MVRHVRHETLRADGVRPSLAGLLGLELAELGDGGVKRGGFGFAADADDLGKALVVLYWVQKTSASR